jgi:hypothetical protein
MTEGESPLKMLGHWNDRVFVFNTPQVTSDGMTIREIDCSIAVTSAGGVPSQEELEDLIVFMLSPGVVSDDIGNGMYAARVTDPGDN